MEADGGMGCEVGGEVAAEEGEVGEGLVGEGGEVPGEEVALRCEGKHMGAELEEVDDTH